MRLRVRLRPKRQFATKNLKAGTKAIELGLGSDTDPKPNSFDSQTCSMLHASHMIWPIWVRLMVYLSEWGDKRD